MPLLRGVPPWVHSHQYVLGNDTTFQKMAQPTTFMNLDWKFAVGSIIATASVIVPIWIWQSDQTPYSLSLRLASSVALSQGTKSPIPDLVVMVGGTPIETPYLSTLELSNAGTKPILASDFEVPLELVVAGGAAVVRARISSSVPDDLRPEITSDAQTVSMKPLLLNPRDIVTFAVLTSGSQPIFSPRSRISGISEVKYEDATKKPNKWATTLLGVTLSYAGIAIYFVFGVIFARPNAFEISRGLSLAVMLVSIAGAMSALRTAFTALDIGWTGTNIVIFLLPPAVFGLLVFLRAFPARTRLP
jgi:hypothetical protein